MNFLQTATNLWEHAKDSVMDTVGTASDRVLPDSYIEDSQSRAILEKLDRITEQSQDIVGEIRLFKQKVSALATCFKNMSSFDIILPNQTEEQNNSPVVYESKGIANIKESIDKYNLLADFLSNISENKIPNEIENEFNDIITRIKSKTEERNEFSQNCLKAERIRKTINSAAESSSSDRVVELLHIEEDVKDRVASLKQILTVELNFLEDKFIAAKKNTLKVIIEYEKESFKYLD